MPRILLFPQNAKSLIKLFLVSVISLWMSIPITASPESDFAEWKKLYEEEVSFEDVINFLETHPDWPSQKTLRKKAEQALTGRESIQKLISWFQKFPPITAEGSFHYAKALVQNEQPHLAQGVIKTAWVEKEFSESFLKEFRATFQNFLTAEDDIKRVNTLLSKEERQAVLDMVPFMDSSNQTVVRARLALLSSQPEADKDIDFQKHKTNSGLTYDLIKWHRRLQHYSEALELLKGSPQNEADFPEAWWTERNLLSRYLIENKQYQQAVNLIKKHQLKMGESYVHAKWMVGWLQLRFLNQPQPAYEQFKKMYALVKSPQSQARFAFWAGEAAKVLKQSTQSHNWYHKAAHHKGTFYGQLAISQLRHVHKKVIPIFHFIKTNAIPASTVSQFEKRPLVRVLKALSQQDKDKYMFFFLFKLSELIHDANEQILLIELAQKIGGNHAITEISREVAKKRYVLTEVAYPTLSSRHQANLLGKVAGTRSLFHSLTHAIIRQESRFNPKAESNKGAAGMMQLMPATAAETVKRLKAYGLSVKKQDSIFNPEKNITLGVVYLDYLLEEFDGNIILVSAAYNAGLGNVRKWLKLFGDPRETKLSWVDWIELLPYSQTRDYIRFILENFMAYQHRLPQTKKPVYDLGQVLTTPLKTNRKEI
jgi:soluble lytic murein transglycosylase